MAVQYCVEYLGWTVLDRRFSSPMVQWVISDIRRRRSTRRINLRVQHGNVIGCQTDGMILFSHPLSGVTRFCHESNNVRTFMYLLKDDAADGLQAHLFRAPEFEDVVEIFQTMKEGVNAPRSQSSAASLTSLCSDISPSNSQFFEVLYVGKIKVSHRHVPDTFIDDALDRIQQHELEKQKKLLEVGAAADKDYFKSKSLEMGRKISNAGEIVPANTQSEATHSNAAVPNNPFLVPNVSRKILTGSAPDVTGAASPPTIVCPPLASATPFTCSLPPIAATENKTDCDKAIVPKLPPPPGGETGYRRNRSGSLGVIETMRPKKTEDPNHNRTMLFYVGRQDIKLISPDRKQVLLHKMLKDVTTCTQGVKKAEHFGLVSREVDSYVGYVFRCESESVAEDVVAAITQSFNYIKEHKPTKQLVLSCEHCPMVWYHKLCAEIEHQNDKKCQMTILKRIESLPEEDQEIIHTKLLGAESSDIKDQVEFLMILLRAHCEAKQAKHLHDTVENRSEFLNQYLGGSTIFMKAKRSLTSSFDQLLKRKGSNYDITSSQSNSKESLQRRSPGEQNGSEVPRRRSSTVCTADVETLRKELKMLAEADEVPNRNIKEQSEERQNAQMASGKKQSLSDIAAITVNNQKIEKNLRESEEKDEDSLKTPMINIFRKVGNSPKSPEDGSSVDSGSSASWRQAIFNRVSTPGKSGDPVESRKKTATEYRDLWHKAINQQVLLIRMEKENARLRARQEEATVKRIKLEYDELGGSSREYMGIWDLISKDSRVSSSKCDAQMLLQAIRQGVPRGKRGDVWHFLAAQYCMKQPPFDSSKFPNYDVPYEDLLKKLTSCQHAILIDLGRTFPNHPYFASPLGPGQLALFNLLKAYSLLDPQVGYCQGLSFVAAVLLLHMAEDQAFLLLRHLMFRRGLRRQYLPDMAALQVHLYQLSRLLHDHYPQLYRLFDENDIAPTLYAAPWILTLFASQFPLGFVTRVFDLLFLESTSDVVFRVILALLDEHNEKLHKLNCFEDIMDYLKINLPKMDGAMLDKVMKQVLSMDISKQMHEYEVEYHVLQEEMSSAKPELEQLKKMSLENQRLTDQNLALIEQLQVVNQSANRLERARNSHQSTVNKLEQQIRNLEITIATLAEFIEDIGVEHKDIQIPGDIRRLIANLQLAEQRSTKLLKAELNVQKKFDKTLLLKRSQTSMGFYERPTNNELYTSDDLPNGTKYGEHSPRRPSIGDSPKPIVKGVPLRVIVDEDDNRPSEPSNFSKLTSGVSSFFNSKNQKNVKNILEGTVNSSYSDEERQMKCDDNTIKKSFSGEIGSLSLREGVVNPTKKLQKTQSEFAIKCSHPLDTGADVNITYNGVTKLKTLKPAVKSTKDQNVQNIDLITLSNNILHVHEEDLGIKGSRLLNGPLFGTVTEKF